MVNMTQKVNVLWFVCTEHTFHRYRYSKSLYGSTNTLRQIPFAEHMLQHHRIICLSLETGSTHPILVNVSAVYSGGRREHAPKLPLSFKKSPFCLPRQGIPNKRGLLQGGEIPAPIKAIHWVELPGRMPRPMGPAAGWFPTIESKEFVYFTSSIIAVSLASPRRTPVRVMRV